LKYAPLALEPFAERIGGAHDFDGAAGYRIGYRLGRDGTAISSVTVSADIIEKTLNLSGSIGLAVTLDGQVTAVVSHSDFTEVTLRGASSIDGLVQNALDFENLRMEEATTADLNALLERLEHSVRLVKSALSRMRQEQKQSAST
jgi:hypothetical protein